MDAGKKTWHPSDAKRARVTLQEKPEVVLFVTSDMLREWADRIDARRPSAVPGDSTVVAEVPFAGSGTLYVCWQQAAVR